METYVLEIKIGGNIKLLFPESSKYYSQYLGIPFYSDRQNAGNLPKDVKKLGFFTQGIYL